MVEVELAEATAGLGGWVDSDEIDTAGTARTEDKAVTGSGDEEGQGTKRVREVDEVNEINEFGELERLFYQLLSASLWCCFDWELRQSARSMTQMRSVAQGSGVSKARAYTSGPKFAERGELTTEQPQTEQYCASRRRMQRVRKG